MSEETRVVLTVDKTSGEPAYLQIINQVKRDVVLGIRRPGDRLPTIIELAESLGIARPTVGQAIAELQKQGVIETRKSQGSFILQPSQGLLEEWGRDTLGPAVLQLRRVGIPVDRIEAIFAGIIRDQFVERARSGDRRADATRPATPGRRQPR